MDQRHYRLFIRLPLLLLAASLVLVGTFSKRGWLDWMRIAEQNGALTRQLDMVRAKKSDLARRIAPLRHDRQAMQSAVRQHLGYLREDEIIIELPN